MIEIVRYKPEWPGEFLALGAAIRGCLGDRAIAIHHIGSTSVPDLEAKDVIDIQLTVKDLFTFPLEQLLTVGFTGTGKLRDDHCPPGMTLDSRELTKYIYGYCGRRTHLHVREQSRFNQRYPLLCRDYLRAHPLAARAYGEIKRQLAGYFPENVDAYYDIKDPVFDVLMAGAEDWAVFTNWSVPPTDA